MWSENVENIETFLWDVRVRTFFGSADLFLKSKYNDDCSEF